MKRVRNLLLLVLVAACTSVSVRAADLQIFQKITPERPPVDVAVSRSGQWVYVLAESGVLYVYTTGGELKDTVSVGPEVDRIEAGLRDDLLYVSSRSGGSVQMVRIELVHDIPIAGAPHKGPADAPVTVVVFTDFQCPYCAKTAELLDRVAENHPKNVKVVFKNFPLRSHPYAEQAAAAALVADRHGKFWEFHDRLFAEHDRLSNEKILEIARSLGLETAGFSKEMADPRIRGRIQKDVEDGRDAGVRGTPTIFVNGRLLQERSMAGFHAAVSRELERTGATDS